MPFELPPLPFAKNALAPHISEETMTFHYEKHHRAYVDKLNELVKKTLFDTLPLEQVVLRANGKVLNNAAQAWNHAFFWNCLTPHGGRPSSRLEDLINSEFTSLQAFRTQFSQRAVELFGSGWTWLSLDVAGRLSIDALGNAGNPLRNGKRPLLALDVWEHAYYLDHRNDRAGFVSGFWDLVNWQFVSENLEAGLPPSRQTSRREREAPAAP